MKNLKNRIEKITQLYAISMRELESKCGLKRGNLSNIKDNGTIGVDKASKILDAFPEILPEWLLAGKEPILRPQLVIDHSLIKKDALNGGSPFYEDLPVSAGKIEISDIKEQPTGYIKIPGISPLAYFPVIGCSLKPEINPGDIIGVNQLDKWDKVDPDKVYMIITHEDRMIKHLRTDEDRTDILWCISPNYKEFSIHKEEIKAIYHVVFTGRLI